MEERFYTILGVGQDADADAIRRAYREQVKECHPDVSDDANASERFKRLTTARDVLLDTDARATYDRLGHDAYVSQYVETDIWSSQSERFSPNDESRVKGRRQSAANSHSVSRNTEKRARTRGPRADSTQTARGGRQQWHTHRRGPRSSRADGGYTDEDWQRASDAYLRADTSVSVPSSPLRTVLGAVSRIGPWLFIHLVLVVSALATTWFMLTRPETDPAIAVATGVLSVLLVGVALMLSVVHLLTELS